MRKRHSMMGPLINFLGEKTCQINTIQKPSPTLMVFIPTLLVSYTIKTRIMWQFVWLFHHEEFVKGPIMEWIFSRYFVTTPFHESFEICFKVWFIWYLYHIQAYALSICSVQKVVRMLKSFKQVLFLQILILPVILHRIKFYGDLK